MAPLCTLKLIIIGESGVGKTCLLVRFVDGFFKDTSKPTIIDLKVQTIQIDGNLVKLEIWDTAGQERYKSISKEYYRNADGVILMYDVTDIETYYKMSTWLSEIREHTDGVVIIGNKNEDPAAKTVQSTAVKRFARDEGLEFMEISAKTGDNVDQVFKILVAKAMEQRYPSLIVPNKKSEIMDLPPKIEVTPKRDDVIRLSKKRKKKEKKKRCC